METYNTDIEMVMDFMKLAIIFDNKSVSRKNRGDALKLQQSILEMLPVAQSNRMSQIYKFVRDIYAVNKREFSGDMFSPSGPIQGSVQGPIVRQVSTPLDGMNKDNFIVLFHRSSCPACKSVMPVWQQFKGIHKTNPGFTVLDWDSDDPKNSAIFKYFKIEFVPTVFKLELTKQDIITKLDKNITLGALTDLIRFD